MLSKKIHYLQIALNSTLDEAKTIIQSLPVSERIIIEAGTPLIKTYGLQAVQSLAGWWGIRTIKSGISPYIVADLKTMDRGETEVRLAKMAGASAVVGLGQAPKETIDAFIESCKKYGMDSYVDMMNVDQPIKVLRTLKHPPTVVLLHRGVDETTYNTLKPIPYLQINKVRASSDVLIGIGGGDTPREVQRAVFNGANIVVVWKEFYQSGTVSSELAEAFLKEIK